MIDLISVVLGMFGLYLLGLAALFWIMGGIIDVAPGRAEAERFIRRLGS